MNGAQTIAIFDPKNFVILAKFPVLQVDWRDLTLPPLNLDVEEKEEVTGFYKRGGMYRQ